MYSLHMQLHMTQNPLDRVRGTSAAEAAAQCRVVRRKHGGALLVELVELDAEFDALREVHVAHVLVEFRLDVFDLHVDALLHATRAWKQTVPLCIRVRWFIVRHLNLCTHCENLALPSQ